MSFVPAASPGCRAAGPRYARPALPPPRGRPPLIPPRPFAVDFVTLPYPGFATDLQPQMMAMLSIARETSILTENVFESRFMFVDELIRMGADIRVEGHHAVIRGQERLSAAPVRALDIRAGAAMVIAALVAEGASAISDVHYIDRGYEDFVGKLGALGARIRREREHAPAYA